MQFEWDDYKNRQNLIKHAMNFETAAKVFKDPYRIERYDKKHSIFEDRYITIGEINEKYYVVMVVYTERQDCVRIMSARKATDSERRIYYDSKKKY